MLFPIKKTNEDSPSNKWRFLNSKWPPYFQNGRPERKDFPYIQCCYYCIATCQDFQFPQFFNYAGIRDNSTPRIQG